MLPIVRWTRWGRTPKRTGARPTAPYARHSIRPAIGCSLPVSYQAPGSDATSAPAAPAPVDESPADPSESSPAAEAAAIESPAAEGPAAEPPAAELTPAEATPPAGEPASDAGQSADPPEGANAAADAADAEKSPPEIVISPTPQGLMITSDDPEALDTIQSLVQMFASQEAGTQPQFHLFYLKHVEAETARTLITSILTGVTSSSAAATLGSAASSSGNSGRTGVIGSLMQGRPASTPTAAFSTMPHIVADKRLNALFVNGSPEQIALVKQLLEVVDTESGPEEVLTFPRPKFIPVLHMKAETVADVLRQVYANRVESGTNNNNRNQDDQRGRGFPPGFAERFGMMQPGGDGNRQGRTAQQAAGDQPKMTIGVDVESNAVIVSAQGPLLKEVESVVAELDRRALNKPAENIAVVTLKRTNPQLLRETIANLLGDTVEVTQSSAGTANSQSSHEPQSIGQCTRRRWAVSRFRRFWWLRRTGRFRWRLPGSWRLWWRRRFRCEQSARSRWLWREQSARSRRLWREQSARSRRRRQQRPVVGTWRALIEHRSSNMFRPITIAQRAVPAASGASRPPQSLSEEAILAGAAAGFPAAVRAVFRAARAVPADQMAATSARACCNDSTPTETG